MITQIDDFIIGCLTDGPGSTQQITEFSDVFDGTTTYLRVTVDPICYTEYIQKRSSPVITGQAEE